MSHVPKSPYEKTAGMFYVPRMLDKIRLMQAGTLREDLRENLGKGFDGTLCNHLRVDYEEVKARVLAGASDEEVLQWCYATGRDMNEADVVVWNLYISKVGWKDHISEILIRRKRESGLENRDDIQTMFDYLDADEGRLADPKIQ